MDSTQPPVPVLEQVIVTSSRRPQRAQTEPSAIAQINRQAIEGLHGAGAVDTLRRLPGINFQQNNGVENLPALRSPVLTGGAAAGSILYLEDGVPIRAPGFGNVNQVFELNAEIAEAIEVTRGPGAAVYGSNALNGVVNVLTPSPREAQGVSFALEAGRYGRRYGQTAIGAGPAVLALSVLDDGGYREQASVDLQKAFLRLEWGLGSGDVSWSITLQNLAQETAGFIADDRGYTDRALARTNPTPGGFRDQTLVRTQATLRLPLSSKLELRLVPFGRWIDTELALVFFPSQALEQTGQFGGGVLSTLYWQVGGHTTLVLGIDADRSQGRLSEIQRRPNVGSFIQGVHYDYRVDSLALAGFVQADMQFPRGWVVQLGTRLERVTFDYDNLTISNDLGRFRRPADRRDAFYAVSPKLGFSKTLNTRATAFFSYRRGARPPQASDLYSLQTQQRVGESGVEVLDQLEGGLRWGAEPLKLELVGYWAGRRGGSFRNSDGLTVDDARTRSLGIEASYQIRLTRSVSLEGWATRAEHTYRFDDATVSPSDTVVAGRQVDTAPRWLAQTSLQWRPNARTTLSADWRRSGGYFLDAANSVRQSGFNVVDFGGSVRVLGNARIFLDVRNALNAKYPERADFAFGSVRYFPGEPISARIGLAASF